MRGKYLLSYLLCSVATITVFSSYHGGAANGGLGNRTGSPGTGYCGDCHNGGVDTTFSGVAIRKKGDTAKSNIKYYTVNSLYTITVYGKHSQYDRFGFQAVVLDSHNNPIGTFVNFDAYSHGYPSVNPVFAEHNTRIPKDTNGGFEVSFDWRAPATWSGKLTLYGIVNAVNNDGQPSFDKSGQTMSVSMEEDITSPNRLFVDYSGDIALFPCPADDFLAIKFMANQIAERIQLVSFSGRTVLNVGNKNFNNELRINTSAIPDGYYMLRLESKSSVALKKILIAH